MVKRGPNAGSRFLLDRSTTSAGRHPDSDIFLDDVTVSRRHAEFRRDAGEFVVVDVGSLNGTYVNREPVDTAVLANGDEVQIGKFRLVFLTGPRDAPEPERLTRGRRRPSGGGRRRGVARVASTASDAATVLPRAGPERRETEDRQEEEHA